jgi:hypothetical protein
MTSLICFAGGVALGIITIYLFRFIKRYCLAKEEERVRLDRIEQRLCALEYDRKI